MFQRSRKFMGILEIMEPVNILKGFQKTTNRLLQTVINVDGQVHKPDLFVRIHEINRLSQEKGVS
jgi:hypothetical protein